MKFKIGDKYICTESKVNYWTVGKEYPVQLRTGTNPCIVDDEGTGWYPDGYEMYATFKLNKMKFKKGDIVEVINEDKWQGIDYPVGTQLRVYEDQEDECVVRIYDSMQKQGGYAKLWEWNLKLVKREGEKPKLDLNNLTTAELREYVELVEAKEEAEFLLECFIEKVTK